MFGLPFEIDPSAQRKSGVGLLVSAEVGLRKPLSRNHAIVGRINGSARIYPAADTDDIAIEGRIGIETLGKSSRLTPEVTYHALIAPDGRMIVGNLPHVSNASANGMTRIEADIYVDGDEEDHLALAYDHRFRTGARLIVGRDIEDIAQNEELLQSAVPWTLGVSVFLGIIGGVVMSFAIGRRIDEVSSTARLVIAGDLSGRVPLRGTNDDFDRLAETFNLMLDRIELSMEAVQRVSDHVAHELKTPLARAQMLLERIRRIHASNDAESVATLLSVLASEGERLQAIFDALLRISRIETGALAPHFQRLDLKNLVDDAVDLYGPAIDEKQLMLVVHPAPPALIMGDSDLVAQAVCNLIDNAIKYVPHQGRVEIELVVTDRDIELRICDNGPGMDAETSERLTERFFRGTNVDNVEGYGLGLSLVAAVARAHGSSLAFENQAPGLCVIWKFACAGGARGKSA
ncbi:HAMP domain-containing sensor histidine kinase [Sphingobium yanoikuyae]|uniref:HAMP domain-containing sensor histidine kinase n=1 Tax=Sphingobium yanoikuyae TaxID=13690 RepID=UPI0035C6C9AC